MYARESAVLATQALGVVHHLLQCQHSQQGDGELGNDEDAGHGAELVVHGHVVEEEIGEAHEVLAPREQDAQHGGSQQTPLHGTADDEQSEEEEHQHEGTDVHRSARAGLLAPVLGKAAIDGSEGRVGMRHRGLVIGEQLAGAALRVGHEQRPRLADAVAPHCDVATLQPAVGLVRGVLGLLRQLALATHAFLAVLPRVIEVAQVDADAQDAADGKATGRFQPSHELLLANGLDEVGQRHQTDDEEEIVRHLHMIAEHLHGGENACHHDACQVLAAIAEHHAADGGGNEAQGQQLPDVAGLYDDEIVTAEGP